MLINDNGVCMDLWTNNNGFIWGPCLTFSPDFRSTIENTPFSHLIILVGWQVSLLWVIIIPNQLGSRSTYIDQSTRVFFLYVLGWFPPLVASRRPPHLAAGFFTAWRKIAWTIVLMGPSTKIYTPKICQNMTRNPTYFYLGRSFYSLIWLLFGSVWYKYGAVYQFIWMKT
jgi:hypothetical protein